MTTSDEQQAGLTGRVPEHADLLVVGGGPAALAAATGYRDHGGEGTVVLVSDDDTLPYFRPPLSKDYLRGETEEADLLIEPESAYEDADIEARLNVMVTALDAGERTAVLSDGARLTYEHCVLATGAAPKPLPVPGADDPRVAYLRTLDSARTLRTAAEAVRSAVVAGSGFIGCEAAASLARRGLDVTVVSTEELPQQARLGPDVGERIAGWLRDEGVTLVGGAEVEAIEDAQLVRISGREPVRGTSCSWRPGSTRSPPSPPRPRRRSRTIVSSSTSTCAAASRACTPRVTWRTPATGSRTGTSSPSTGARRTRWVASQGRPPPGPTRRGRRPRASGPSWAITR
ncbi:MAG TPA: NAD(P)/FAD-dependent oxidoreductase [Pseudonocardia sp.]|jgi:hypothetical protein|nr:NAD(P)/FAD-dependent oxidoreductase [Pseudonocardia sp.]